MKEMELTMPVSTLELWQTEWCPSSHRVRQRLTELGLTFTAHQVPVKPQQRHELLAATGSDSIPVLVANGEVVVGEQPILSYLDAHFSESQDAAEQQTKAAAAARKQQESLMPTTLDRYTLTTTTTMTFADAVTRVREELAKEGFGVLAEIDVQATLRQKLDIEREPYLILGACNPPLAHAALEVDPEVGALLPCNVIVYRRDEQTHVAAIDPERMLAIVGNDDLSPTASEVRRRLANVIERLADRSRE